MLSEVATRWRWKKIYGSGRRWKGVACALSRKKVFVELPPEDLSGGDGYRCGMLQCSFSDTRDPEQKWEEVLGSTLWNLQTTAGIGCLCVRRGFIKNEHDVATGHGGDITIGGERSAVDCSVRIR